MNIEMTLLTLYISMFIPMGTNLKEIELNGADSVQFLPLVFLLWDNLLAPYCHHITLPSVYPQLEG